MFQAVLPCIVRFGEAFPPLLDDCILFLMQLGRIAESQTSLGRSASMPTLYFHSGSRLEQHNQKIQSSTKLVAEVTETFSKLLDKAVLKW
jgi:integrator complex subunit 2